MYGCILQNIFVNTTYLQCYSDSFYWFVRQRIIGMAQLLIHLHKYKWYMCWVLLSKLTFFIRLLYCFPSVVSPKKTDFLTICPDRYLTQPSSTNWEQWRLLGFQFPCGNFLWFSRWVCQLYVQYSTDLTDTSNILCILIYGCIWWFICMCSKFEDPIILHYYFSIKDH